MLFRSVGGALYTLGLLLMAVSSTGLLLNLSAGLILGLALSATEERTNLMGEEYNPTEHGQIFHPEHIGHNAVGQWHGR